MCIHGGTLQYRQLSGDITWVNCAGGWPCACTFISRDNYTTMRVIAAIVSTALPASGTLPDTSNYESCIALHNFTWKTSSAKLTTKTKRKHCVESERSHCKCCLY